MKALSILYDVDGLVIVNKPPGLPSTGRDLSDPDCAQSVAMRQLGRKLWAVHQLDADTSGALLLTRRRSLVAPLSRRLKAPGSGKDYLAICHGVPGWKSRRVEAPLGYDRGQRKQVITPQGKAATTLFRVLSMGDEAALIEARLLTGRTHQIRVHLESLGHPLLGEQRYREAPCARHPRHALHAHRLRLRASGGSPRIEVNAPAPDALRILASRLGLVWPT